MIQNVEVLNKDKESFYPAGPAAILFAAAALRIYKRSGLAPLFELTNSLGHGTHQGKKRTKFWAGIKP